MPPSQILEIQPAVLRVEVEAQTIQAPFLQSPSLIILLSILLLLYINSLWHCVDSERLNKRIKKLENLKHNRVYEV